MTLAIKATVLAGTALAATLMGSRLMNMYTVPPKWSGYDSLGRSYLTAALAGDSAALRKLTGSNRAYDWARLIAKEHPADVEDWSHNIFATGGGAAVGDTMIVDFTTTTQSCTRSILMLWIAGGQHGKVTNASWNCFP